MGLLDGLFGDGGDSETAAALRELQGISIPDLKKYYPELYQQAVQMNPELENAVTLGPSAMEGVSTDPRLKQAQMGALNKLMGISDAGGKDAQFIADSSRVKNDINSNLKGNQDAIVQNMATRGMSGGMSEMVARNQATQGAANRQAQMDLDLNAQAQQRALSALMNGGQMAGNMQAQDFSQQAQVAGSKDAISRFNAQNTQQVRNNNVNAKNSAQQWNATNAQNTSDRNTGARNDAQIENNKIIQQGFNNRMTKAGAVANAHGNSAAAKNASRQGNMQLTGNLIGAVATGGASLASQAAKAPSSGAQYATMPAFGSDDEDNPWNNYANNYNRV